MFKIKSLTILDGCKYCKNLRPGTYSLATMDDSWGQFFGKDLIISAIVGKNGSGKSTLLEMIFRIVNNVNSYVCSHLYKEGIPPTFFIDGIRAKLSYAIDENNYEIVCDRSLIQIFQTDNDNQLIHSFDCRRNNDQLRMDIFSRTNLMSKFFYIIGINYSPLAYNEHDYSEDSICSINNRHEQCEVHGCGNWMHNLFHKNDGYSVSINLNPFRDNGSINSDTELILTRSRLAALLLKYPDSILDKYTLHSVNYHFNPSFFRKNFGIQNSDKTNKEIISDYSRYIKYPRSCCYRLLTILLHEEPNLRSSYREVASLYICYKALNIAERYPQYSEYSKLLTTELLTRIGNVEQMTKIEEYAHKLRHDRSHVTLKLRQAIHFYESLKGNIKLFDLLHKSGSSKPFSYDQYRNACEDKEPKNILKQMTILPPSFFECNIKLSLKSDPEHRSISLSELSTGEKQFAYSTAAIIYHMLNIRSVPSQRDRIHYRNILVVLDEAELSYHPEYQRTYINNLINLVNRLKLTRALNIHFLLTTHSPFMLSDIPKCNILYLQEGKDISEKIHTPFCANINDILSQNFFLSEKGMTGEFAKHKVLEAFEAMKNSHLKKNRDKWTTLSLKHLIDSIGDKLIRQQMELQYINSEFVLDEDIDKEIKVLNNRLDKLIRRKNKI